MKFQKFLMVSAIGALPLVSARGEIMTADGFEDGNFDRWRLQTWGKENLGSIAKPPVLFEGENAFRAVANPTAAEAGRFWCEVGRYFAKMGDTRWWGFAMLIPEDFPVDGQNAVLCQLHSGSDKTLGEQALVPEIVLRLVKDTFYIDVRSDAGELSTTERWGKGGTVTSQRIYEGPIEKGKWISWVFQVRLSFEDGLVKVWRDGEIVADYTGPVGLNNEATKSLRIGLYKKFYKDLPPEAGQVIWFDAFSIAGENAGFDAVNPNPDGTKAAGKPPTSYQGPLHGESAPSTGEFQ